MLSSASFWLVEMQPHKLTAGWESLETARFPFCRVPFAAAPSNNAKSMRNVSNPEANFPKERGNLPRLSHEIPLKLVVEHEDLLMTQIKCSRLTESLAATSQVSREL